MRTLALAAFFVMAAPIAAQADDAPLARIVIKPGVMTETAGGTLEITEIFPAMVAAAGAPLLSIGNQAPGMTRPQPLDGLTVTDAQGAVPLTSTDVEGARTWSPTRTVAGDLTIRYRLPIQNDNRAGGGPPVNPRIDGDGVSAVGTMLLIQPKTDTPYRVAVTWDLAAMGAGAEGVSTFGDGDIVLPAGPLARLNDSFVMAGHLKRQPEASQRAFQAVWSGTPPFDPRPSLRWADTLYVWMSRFFEDPSEPPYRIFLRYNPAANAGGGAAYPRSFLWTYGDGVAADHLKTILGHEMTHTWTAADVGKWFSEGDAVYYQAQLPWRAGLFTSDDYLADINKTAARYYTNDLIRTADADVMATYWSDVRLIVIPYDRGAIYFATLNGMIRKSSGGARSIDDLIRVVVDRNRKGQATSEADWILFLRRELGDPGLAVHRAMMAGEILLPDSDAYGPCFRRIPAKIRRNEVGFRLTKPTDGGTSIVQNLIPGSEAARAGIRDGDQIVLRTNTDGAQRDPKMTLTVKITRNGKTFPITYLPRGAEVDAYQWERVPGVPDSACKA